MAFFNKRKEAGKGKLKVEEIKVATTIIFSNYNDGTGACPRYVKWYLLVREINGKYHEIFSDKQIEMETSTYHDGFTSLDFNTPYIRKLEPLAEYLINPNEKVISLQVLFDFMLDMNVSERLGAFNNIED